MAKPETHHGKGGRVRLFYTCMHLLWVAVANIVRSRSKALCWAQNVSRFVRNPPARTVYVEHC